MHRPSVNTASRPASRRPLGLLCALSGLTLVGCIDYDVDRRKTSDTWPQPSQEGGVDVLWVVDDSQSMFEEQAQLALHAAAFTSFLSNVAVDFQLGVTTTNTSEGAGALMGPLLSQETVGLTQAFADAVENEAEGDREEQGFTAALAALDGGEFGRPEADLEVVFFSDEDDQSGMSPEDFVAALHDLRPSANIVVNAIVGDLPEGCASYSAAADPGAAYVEAQLATDGLRDSICAADYDAMLERLATQVLGLQTTFALTAVPDVDSMEVYADTALIHPRARHGWRYDPGLNAVIFDGYAVPPPGARVEARYYEWQGNEPPDAEAAEE